MTDQTAAISLPPVLHDSPGQMPSRERALTMLKLVNQLLDRLAEGDASGASALFVEEPQFGLYPAAVTASGFAAFWQAVSGVGRAVLDQMDRRRGDEELKAGSIGFNEKVLVAESTVVLDMPNGDARRCSWVIVYEFDGDLLAGLRLYSDKYLAAVLSAPAVDESYDALGPVGHGRALLRTQLMKALDEMPSPERAAEMLQVDMNYAQYFFDGDFDGTENHLVAHPAYELHPESIRLEGLHAVHARSERLHGRTMKQIDARLASPGAVDEGAKTLEYHALAYGKDAFLAECSMVFRLTDGSTQRCHWLPIVRYVEDKMYGEFVYGDRYMAANRADLWDDAFFATPGVTTF